MMIDFAKVTDVELDDVSYDHDYWCDTYVCSALIDGREATEEELDAINENSDFVFEEIQNYLY